MLPQDALYSVLVTAYDDMSLAVQQCCGAALQSISLPVVVVVKDVTASSEDDVTTATSEDDDTSEKVEKSGQ